MNKNIEDSEQTIDDKYSNIYANLTEERDDLNNNIEDIRDNVRDIEEADSAFQVAINGFKGLGNVLKLPINFIDSAVNTYKTLLTSVEIPLWSKTLITMGLLSVVLFVIVGILRGGGTL